MWIRTQNKQRIINSDQIIDIFIDKTGKKIYAETTRDGDFFELGEYANRGICTRLLAILLTLMGRDKITFLELPSDEEVTDERLEKCENETKSIFI